MKKTFSFLRSIQHVRQRLESLDLEGVARQSGWMSRCARKLCARDFLLALMALPPHAVMSLESIASTAALITRGSYSKQAVGERVHAGACRFLTRCLPLIFGLCEKAPATSLLAGFRRVLIHDSTTLALPKRFAHDFPGASNQQRRRGSLLKVQVICDLIGGGLLHLALSGFTRNDQAAAPDIFKVARPGDLILRDLGYFTQECFARMVQKGLFFLSRWRHGTQLFDPVSGKPLDIARRLKSDPFFDAMVLLGENKRLPVRLVALPVPDQVASQRRRLARAHRDRRLNPSPKRLFLMGWSLFITNVDALTWPTPRIAHIYRLRWRIETTFKAWKSHLHYEQLNTRNLPLLRLSLMVKLLSCALFHSTCACLAKLSNASPPSLLRVARLFADSWLCFACSLLRLNPLQYLSHMFKYRASHERRLDRPNFYDVLNSQSFA